MGLPKRSSKPSEPKRPPPPAGSVRRDFERAFALARGGFGGFFSICVLTRVPPYLLRFLYILVFIDAADDPGPLNLSAAVAVILYEGLSWVLGALALAAAISAADQGRPLSVIGAFRAGFARLSAGLKTAALGGIFVGVGLAALLIPGLILLYQFSFAWFAVAVEGLEGKAALDSSRALVRAYPTRTLATLGLAAALSLGVAGAAMGSLNLALGFVYGLFDLPENSLATAFVFDLARRVVFQCVPVAVAVYWWVAYAEFAAKVRPEKSGDEIELIAL
ncbi:MAG: hypothetical protein COX66_09995 [Elusimicrobia bacterium CG_4_10_14_0_2_um_filter_63_34]|nr:MAG: hypothetical protein COX66_09995 [Elusimicrobia bacterium CG_4_10_14_0_2_um_filter_63_34]